ncbi:hypothetical protein CYMTET_3923 [Cymbomonas tetramitiformis]|uniref:FHA domain-containing protein n=1 Tax=Cymbomonas tetramitiformis TaxID=36881 RepID=A0AAE0H2G1_9CHLO|nr:hypothetical protein CYMTET_3923 [Cymbomonas tetramitiformis]
MATLRQIRCSVADNSFLQISDISLYRFFDTNRRCLRIGRHRANDVVLGNEQTQKLSNFHCIIDLQLLADGGCLYTLENTSDTNGCFVEAVAIPSGEKRPITHGTLISLDPSRVLFTSLDQIGPNLSSIDRVLQFKGWGSGMFLQDYGLLCDETKGYFQSYLPPTTNVDFAARFSDCVLNTLNSITTLVEQITNNTVIVQWDGDGYFDDVEKSYSNYTAGLLGVLRFLYYHGATVAKIVITKLITKKPNDVLSASRTYASTLFDKKMVSLLCAAIPSDRSVPVIVATFSQPHIVAELQENPIYQSELYITGGDTLRLSDGFSGAMMNRLFVQIPTTCLMLGGGQVLIKELVHYRYHDLTSVCLIGVSRSQELISVAYRGNHIWQ